MNKQLLFDERDSRVMQIALSDFIARELRAIDAHDDKQLKERFQANVERAQNIFRKLVNP